MCKTIKQKVKLQLSPKRVYQLLVNPRHHAALTGQKAVISQKVGGRFSTRAGHVSGINVELVPGKRLVQAWRTREFPVGVFSMATFHLSPTKDGGTDLILTHRGVPKDLIPSIESDWRQYCWEKMRALAK